MKGVFGIGVDENGKPLVNRIYDRRKEPVVLNADEKACFKIILAVIQEHGGSVENMHLERRSDNYLSIVSDETSDFCRIKMGINSKWFSLAFDRKKFIDDPRIRQEKDKGKRHYKINVKSPEDLKRYGDIICHARMGAF